MNHRRIAEAKPKNALRWRDDPQALVDGAGLRVHPSIRDAGT
jgi:hypothetical protein